MKASNADSLYRGAQYASPEAVGAKKGLNHLTERLVGMLKSLRSMMEGLNLSTLGALFFISGILTILLYPLYSPQVPLRVNQIIPHFDSSGRSPSSLTDIGAPDKSLVITVETQLPQQTVDRAYIEAALTEAVRVINECMSSVRVAEVRTSQVPAFLGKNELPLSDSALITVGCLYEGLLSSTELREYVATRHLNAQNKSKLLIGVTPRAIHEAGNFVDGNPKRNYYSQILLHELVHVMGFDERDDDIPNGLFSASFAPNAHHPEKYCAALRRYDDILKAEIPALSYSE